MFVGQLIEGRKNFTTVRRHLSWGNFLKILFQIFKDKKVPDQILEKIPFLTENSFLRAVGKNKHYYIRSYSDGFGRFSPPNLVNFQ